MKEWKTKQRDRVSKMKGKDKGWIEFKRCVEGKDRVRK